MTLLYNTDNSAVGNKKYSEKMECYKGSDFIMTKTLIKPMVTTVINGKDTKLYTKINEYEKQYSVKGENWTKDLIDIRSRDLALLMYCLLLGNI